MMMNKDHEDLQPTGMADPETTPGAVFTVTGMADPAGTPAFFLAVTGAVCHDRLLSRNITMNLCFSTRILARWRGSPGSG